MCRMTPLVFGLGTDWNRGFIKFKNNVSYIFMTDAYSVK